MKQRLVWGFTLGLAMVSPSCGLSPCIDGVGAGASYDVEVVAPYVDGGAYRFTPNGGSYFASSGSCQSFDGVDAGVTLSFKGVGTMSDQAKTCDMVTAQAVSLPMSVTANGPSKDAVALRQIRATSGFMYALEDATVGDCSGTLVFGFFSGGGPGGVFGTPTAGQNPPTVLYRLF